MRLLTALLMVVGFLVIGSCSLLFPPKPLEQSWAIGTYRNGCCAPLALPNGVLSPEGRSSAYRIEPGKHGYILNMPEGISVEAGHVLFGGNNRLLGI
jgi:hypothetical protein